MEEKEEVKNNINAVPLSFKYIITTKEGEIETQNLEFAYIIDKLNDILEKLEKK